MTEYFYVLLGILRFLLGITDEAVEGDVLARIVGFQRVGGLIETLNGLVEHPVEAVQGAAAVGYGGVVFFLAHYARCRERRYSK
jgi:hypothetical protein